MGNFLKTFLGYLIVLVGTSWVIGFIVFSIFAMAIKYTPLESAEAIVALTGGSDRIKEAIRLLEENKAPRLFISGVNESVTGFHLLKEISPELSDKIELGYQAKTTRMNAVETESWLKQNDIHSIILVTSFYHMPRSLLEVKQKCPFVKITPYPIFPQSFEKDTSWIHTRYAWQLFLEYHKFLVVYLRHKIEGVK